MIKYILTIDYKANRFPAFEHYELEASNLLDAIREAEKQLRFENDVYLAIISEKDGKSFKGSFGEKCTRFNMILTSCENCGWRTKERHQTIVQSKYTHSTIYNFE